MALAGAISDKYQKDTPVKQHKPTLKEQETAKYIQRQWDDSERAKQQVIEDAWIGLAFFTGRQWARYNRVTRVMGEDNPPPWRVRMVLNYIMPTVETLAGKLVENRPGFMAMPATSDDDDVEAARQCERLLDYVWHELKMQNKLHEAAKWMAISGTVFFKAWWDPDGGEEYEEEDGDLEALEYVEEVEGEAKGEKTVRKMTGFPMVDVLSPLEVGWDPGAKDMESCRWMTHANMMHIDEVRERWPKKGKFVQTNAVESQDQFSQQILREFSRQSEVDDAMLDRVMVYEYFERPSPRHPDGYYAVVAGNVVLEEQDELPYGRLPFFVARHITVPGRLHGEGLIKSIVPAQKELNKSVSQRIENKNIHAHPKWRAEKGSVDKQSFTDEPGEVIFYSRTATRPPEPLPPPPFSPEQRLIEKEQIEHIENISGVSDVTRGQASSQMSGRAIGLLADLDQTKLGPTVREFEAAIEKMASYMLWMWREYMPVPFTLQAVGRNNSFEVFEFYSKQVKSTRVRVMANSMLPKHPSYRREQIMQMYQVGILGDPADPEVQMKTRRMMEFGDMDPLYGDHDRDRNYAREEIHMLANGRPVDVKPWENHIVHIDTHLSFMKSIDYRLLPEEAQLNFERHLAWHYYAESQQQQGRPWWEMYANAGMEDFPPTMPAAEEQPGGIAGPPAPEMGMMPPEAGMMPPGAAPGPPGGLVGGGTPELNQAIGTRGPGVADYEAGFEATPR